MNGLMSVLLSVFLLAGVAPALAFDHGVWDGLLQRHVRPIRDGVATQVDDGGMARDWGLNGTP